MKWKLFETYCLCHHPVLNEELEELVMACGAKILLLMIPTTLKSAPWCKELCGTHQVDQRTPSVLPGLSAKRQRHMTRERARTKWERMKGTQWMIETTKLRCFRLLRRLFTTIAIKVSSLGIRRVTSACHVLYRVPPQGTLRPMPSPCKSPRRCCFSGAVVRGCCHTTYQRLFPSYGVQGARGRLARGCSGNHSNRVF